MRLPRPAIPFLAASVVLAGCGGGSGGGGPWTEYFSVLRQSVNATFTTQRVTLDQAAAVPYASLGFSVNGGSQQMLVLATSANGNQIWTAASHITLMTQEGRIVRSVNLPRDRAATTTVATAPLPPPAAALKGAFRTTRMIDLPDLGVYSLELNCVSTVRGRQLVEIIGTRMDTMRVDERCESRRLSWTFVDNYWVDAQSGFAWRSVQHVHPRTTVTIEILRPPE